MRSINNYSKEKGIAILIELETGEPKGLRTGIIYERGRRECHLKIDDLVDAHIYENGSSTKISSTICERRCPFGGQSEPNQPIRCNIYKRS